MEQLRRLIPAISNHLLWAAATCQNDAVLLKEKWISVLLHTSNVHMWTSATKFMKCAHDDLDPTDDKEWLVPGDPQHKALHKIVTDGRLLADMEYLSKFQHTGDLEIHRGAELRWVPKRIHFSYEGMRARTQLASMFHNYNVDRRQAKSADGSDQWKVVFPKAKKA